MSLALCSRTVYILLVPPARQTAFARYCRPPFLKHMFGVQIFQLWVFLEEPSTASKELMLKLCMVDSWEMTKLAFSFRHSIGFSSVIFHFKLKKNISSMSLLKISTVVSCWCRSCLNKWQTNYAHILSFQHFALDNRHVILKVLCIASFIIPVEWDDREFISASGTLHHCNIHRIVCFCHAIYIKFFYVVIIGCFMNPQYWSNVLTWFEAQCAILLCILYDSKGKIRFVILPTSTLA